MSNSPSSAPPQPLQRHDRVIDGVLLAQLGRELEGVGNAVKRLHRLGEGRGCARRLVGFDVAVDHGELECGHIDYDDLFGRWLVQVFPLFAQVKLFHADLLVCLTQPFVEFLAVEIVIGKQAPIEHNPKDSIGAGGTVLYLLGRAQLHDLSRYAVFLR